MSELRAAISIDGQMRIYADDETAGYALAQWYEAAKNGEATLSVFPRITLQLGGQKVELKPLDYTNTYHLGHM